MKLADRKAEIQALPNYVADSLTEDTDPYDSSITILTYKLNKVIKKLVDGEVVEEQDGELEMTERWLVHDAGQSTEWIERK